MAELMMGRYSKSIKQILSSTEAGINLVTKPVVMGILNLTPDSFYAGSRYFELDSAVRRAKEMESEGAAIIDIGAQSTRPGAELVSENEELARLLPVLKAVLKQVNIPVSIDTWRSKIAAECLNQGAAIINDISGFRYDSNILKVIADYNGGAIAMHIRGNPSNMQTSPNYQNVVEEVMDYLTQSVNMAIAAGVSPNNLMIDPGIGFGKTPEHNLILLNQSERLAELDYPVMVGVSRKSIFKTVCQRNNPEERLAGSLAAAAWCCLNRISCLRVHDVAETVDVINTIFAISNVSC